MAVSNQRGSNLLDIFSLIQIYSFVRIGFFPSQLVACDFEDLCLNSSDT